MSKKELSEKQKEQMELIKACHEDGIVTIDGTDFKISKLKHKQRLKVFSFFTRIQGMLKHADFSFMDWPDFDRIMELIESVVTVDDMTLAKQPDFWDDEKNAGKYVRFVTTIMPVIAYPLMQGGSGD